MTTHIDDFKLKAKQVVEEAIRWNVDNAKSFIKYSMLTDYQKAIAREICNEQKEVYESAKYPITDDLYFCIVDEFDYDEKNKIFVKKQIK